MENPTQITSITDELKFYIANVDPIDMNPLKKPTTESNPLLKFSKMSLNKDMAKDMRDLCSRFEDLQNLHDSLSTDHEKLSYEYL